MRSKKSIKQDRSRIALGQIHERAYLKRIAREQLKKLTKDKKAKYIRLFDKNGVEYAYRERTAKLVRICRALIKCLRKLK